MWYKLASHLHMSVQRCKRETTSTEFVKWCTFMEMDLSLRHRQDYYMAQIAAEVRRTIAKKPDEVEVEQFLLNFEPAKKKAATPPTEEALAARVAISKARWYAIAGQTPPK